MTRSLTLVLTVLIIASAALSSCGERGSKPSSDRLTVAVIPKGTTHEFWKSVHAGAEKASRELDIDIIWKGPLKEDDRNAQIEVVENFVIRGVSGIVLAPLDDMALRRPVQSAVKNNIPVVIIDSGLNSDDHVSFVATDNYKGGEIAGKHMAKLLNKKGKVVMLRYQEGSASTMKREQGFLDAIGKHEEIDVVSSNQYGGATTESAYKAGENLIAPLKDSSGRLTIDGIFCPNESTTFGMLRALQNAGLAGKVAFVGFDSSIKLVEAMKAGQINALVLQNPLRMGYLGVKKMVEHLNGGIVEKRVDTGVMLVTPENMGDEETKELLQPDLTKWLK